MIATARDVMVLTEADYERLPDENRWEVVDGTALLLPPNDYEHQEVSQTVAEEFRTYMRATGAGFAVSAAGVRIPARRDSWGEIQHRVPDIVVSRHREGIFRTGRRPPELVIEILSTRRGNVERTEKMDDYAAAGIPEYWIFNRFDREVEVYRLQGGEYVLVERNHGILRPAAFPGLEMDLNEIWAILD